MPRGNQFFEGGTNSLQQVLPLGTSTVTTATKVVMAMPKPGIVQEIAFYGQAAVTGTSITAEVKARPTDGGTAVTLQSAAKDVKFASGAAGLAGVTASLATSGLKLLKGQLLEVTITCSSVTAGPGDFLIVVNYQPTAK